MCSVYEFDNNDYIYEGKGYDHPLTRINILSVVRKGVILMLLLSKNSVHIFNSIFENLRKYLTLYSTLFFSWWSIVDITGPTRTNIGSATSDTSPFHWLTTLPLQWWPPTPTLWGSCRLDWGELCWPRRLTLYRGPVAQTEVSYDSPGHWPYAGRVALTEVRFDDSDAGPIRVVSPRLRWDLITRTLSPWGSSRSDWSELWWPRIMTVWGRLHQA